MAGFLIDQKYLSFLGMQIYLELFHIHEMDRDNLWLVIQDILEYKTKIDNARLKVLEKLSEQAQKLKMGYE